MAVLAGGKGANPQAFREQVRMLTLKQGKYGLDADDADTGDHPLVPFRVAAAEGFMATFDYKILKDSFLSLLDMTLKATRYSVLQS